MRRCGSYVPADLLRAADDFEAALPHPWVSASPGGALFQPSAPEPSGLAGSAYALYAFAMRGCSGRASLQLDLIIAPTDPLCFYIALANQDSGRWDIDRYW